MILGVSFSNNALVIEFVGGPMDGEKRLYDHGHFDQIAFGDIDKQVTHEYMPRWMDRWYGKGCHLYDFVRTYDWEPRRKKRRAASASGAP